MASASPGSKALQGGFGRFMLSSFGEPAIKAMVAESVEESMRLENALRQIRSERAMGVLHYAPIVETVEASQLRFIPSSDHPALLRPSTDFPSLQSFTVTLIAESTLVKPQEARQFTMSHLTSKNRPEKLMRSSICRAVSGC